MLQEALKERGIMPVWDQSKPWDERRKEIIAMVEEYEYGCVPGKEDSVTFEEKSCFPFASGNCNYRRAEITAHFGEESYTFKVQSFAPKNVGKAPFFVLIGGSDDMPSCGLPMEEIIDRGFGLVTFCNQSLCVDWDMKKHFPDTDYTMGIYKYLFPDYKDGDPSFSHLAVWAWGAAKCLDYAATLPGLDMDRAAIVGHSRLGKAALYAGLKDERFAYVIPNDSGCAGASLYRGCAGEDWPDVARNFPYWMGPNYGKYVGKIDEVPFDQHFLLAACAPRKVYVSAGSEDIWADGVSMYLSCVAASEVFEKLGMPGFIVPDRLPEAGECFNEGSIGYHLRKGPHDLAREDWNRFMDFIEKN